MHRVDFSELFDASPNAYMVVDRDLKYVAANRAYLQVTGSDLASLVGRSLFELFPHDPAEPNNASRQLLEHSLAEVLRTRQRHVIAHLPYRVAREHGGVPELRIWSATHTPILDAHGEVELILQHTQDVTELAREQAGASSVLARAARVQREMDDVRIRAEAASRAKDDFLAMLAHELRNPLAPILTAVQLLRMRGDVTSEREHAVIERQTQHMVRIVDDLLDVSRIVRGKLELRTEPLEVATAIAKAVEIASPLLEQRRHHLTVDVSAQGLRVLGDEARLAQVVANLLTNAARYTEPGGRVSVTAAREGGEVAIRVRDNGIGIDPVVLPRIFDMFVQGTHHGGEGGLGLGLTLVRRLVELHHGRVTATSEGRGRGTEVVVRLPALATTSATSERRAGAPASRRVLIVDDNVDAASLLAELLERRGYHTIVAHDGREGLRVAIAEAPEVAVIDIGLPELDGYGLARELRQAMGTRTPRMVALTGYGAQHDRDRSMAAGFDAHLTKPVDSATLLRALEPARAA